MTDSPGSGDHCRAGNCRGRGLGAGSGCLVCRLECADHAALYARIWLEARAFCAIFDQCPCQWRFTTHMRAFKSRSAKRSTSARPWWPTRSTCWMLRRWRMARQPLVLVPAGCCAVQEAFRAIGSCCFGRRHRYNCHPQPARPAVAGGRGAFRQQAYRQAGIGPEDIDCLRRMMPLPLWRPCR